MNSRLLIIIGFCVVLVAAVVISTQSGDDDSSDDTTTSGGEISSDLSVKPVIAAGEGDPPTELQVNDIVEGDGPAAAVSDQVTVQYVGALFADGTEFDASWDRGEPFTFELGAGQVIPGWDQGLDGMKVGGRRELIIPADLAYGDQGSPPTIPGGAALIFVVDLEKVK